MKQIHVNVGDQYRLPQNNNEVLRIVSLSRDKDPSVRAAYYADKPEIQLRLSEVKRLIQFGSWIKTKI